MIDPPAQPPADTPARPSRSSFVLVGIAGACAAFGLVYLGYFLSYTQGGSPGAGAAKPRRLALAGLRFAAGVAGPIDFDNGQRIVGIFLSRQGSGLLALEQTCPHQGCPVDWHPDTQRFTCPCHGSQFDRQGALLVGPAPRGLFRHRLQAEPGAVVIGGTLSP